MVTAVGAHFDANDQNREEPSRYVSPDACDYVVELLLARGGASAERCRNLLHCAAASGVAACVQVLLERVGLLFQQWKA